MNRLTASALKTWHDCHRKWKLRYLEGWRPVREPEPLRVGTMIHAGLAAWWTWKAGDGTPSRLASALEAVREYAQDAVDLIRTEEILRGYDLRWKGDIHEVLAVEIEFDAPLVNPDTFEVSAVFRLAGKLDGILKGPTILEHKSTALEIESDADEYWQTLPMDRQLSAYVVGAEALGYEAAECLYDVIRKPLSRFRKATPPDKRKYKKDGSLYANQHEHDETPEEFRLRLREEIEGNLDAYFRRRPVPRLNSEIRNFLSDAWDAAGEIEDAMAKGRFPRNPDACISFGSRCPFYESCLNGADIESSGEFVRLSDPHPELGASTHVS